MFLGIGASHNGGACLIDREGVILAAIQEERLTRKKRDRVVGARECLSIDYVLDAARVKAKDVEAVVLCGQTAYDTLETNPQVNRIKVRRSMPHHLGHAVGAYATSGFDHAAIVVLDGAGSIVDELPADEKRVLVRALPEKRPKGVTMMVPPSATPGEDREFASVYFAQGEASIAPLWKQCAACPHPNPLAPGAPMTDSATIGGLYWTAARQVFGDESAAGKLMGLAPYGRASLTFPVEELACVEGDRLVFPTTLTRRFVMHERWPWRAALYADFAWAVQRACETAVLGAVAQARQRCPEAKNLVLTGGVALNVIANERVIRESGFENVYVQPACEDAGLSIGAAYFAAGLVLGRLPRRKLMLDAVGREYDESGFELLMALRGYTPRAAVPREVAERIARGQFIGLFHGRSELGPRALGQRSILADPRDYATVARLNRVKGREGFRPLAPVVLADDAAEWFDMGRVAESPFMLRSVKVLRTEIPAVTHVDGSARVQTVTQENGPLHAILRLFKAVTGVPVLVNTSFNGAGEPIVETPEDAINTFEALKLDALVLGPWLIERKKA